MTKKELLNSRKVYFISLGCARNRVDSEVMLADLSARGWQITQEPTEADLIVVNTCSFIDDAKEESIETIFETINYRAQNPQLKIVVAGCMPQRYKQELVKGYPEIDLFIGTDEFCRIGELIDQNLPHGSLKTARTDYIYTAELSQINTLSPWSSYVKIAEGCQNRCSFCIIPKIRGPLRSRPKGAIIKEVTQLAQRGVVEIVLIAQDLAAYGRDLQEGSPLLVDLLKEMVQIQGVQWIRLLYLYPENLSTELCEFIRDNPKIVKYLDLPIQHANDEILGGMDRAITGSQLRHNLKKIREIVPDITLRTSVMVGFPGETDRQFDELLRFVKEEEFDHLGCFKFSAQEGTKAAKMADQIAEKVKEDRYNKIMALQKEISRAKLQGKLGKRYNVLVTGESQESELLWEGRLAGQAPEVDGVVYIADGKPTLGKIQTIEITDSHDYDLVGILV